MCTSLYSPPKKRGSDQQEKSATKKEQSVTLDNRALMDKIQR